ncbi:uncharacterized protein [Procambarus clarkii]|uniref:uncharacterized protein n=1 Tax=Procambarus clarkii TaxID=6728 RepID=UPI001E677C44|nr:diaminopimelate decarboxylase 1, chloroplastic-like [Procambarus clarkii]
MERGWVYAEGTLHCDGLSLTRLQASLRQEYGHLASPAYVYSKATLHDNVRRYKNALAPMGTRGVLSYSLKANNNPRVVETLREAGVTMATAVSGNEVLMALRAGFPAHQVILNGNGKRRWEIELAVSRGVLLNVDSMFDARQLVAVSQEMGVRARALVRLNPALDAHTHPFLATALADSKFGVEAQQVPEVLQVLREGGTSRMVEVEGVHVHVGSAITRVQVYALMMQAAVRTLHQICESGWTEAAVINLGGGLNVSHDPPNPGDQDNRTFYNSSSEPQCPPSPPGSEPKPTTKSESTENKSNLQETTPISKEETTPQPEELVEAVLPYLPDGVTLVLEPGRSLVATAGVVTTEVLGVKTNGEREFLVVDAAMTEVIRPALYSAHHPLCYVSPPAHQPVVEVDVVGPVCESGDFLARRCLLQRPPDSGATLVVWAAGAYCSSMSSNYNLRPHALEVMVDGPSSYKIIRRPQEFEDLVRECL